MIGLGLEDGEGSRKKEKELKDRGEAEGKERLLQMIMLALKSSQKRITVQYSHCY